MKKIVWMDSASYTEGRLSLEEWATLVSPGDWPGQLWQISLREAEAAVATARYRFDAAVLEESPRLKIIARLGVGYDNIDVPAATAAGVCVTITPDGSTQAVAEHAMAMLLSLSRRIREADHAVRNGQWGDRQRLQGPDLASLTLGIVGLGRIGSRLAHIARAGIGMSVLAYDPYLTAEVIANRGAQRCASLAELLGNADVVSLHVPGNEETRGMIYQDTLALFRPGALLINTARGSVVVENDLAVALQSGQLAGAALDVFAGEPPEPGSLLLRLPQVLLSPHSAGISTDSLRRIGLQAAEQVRRVLCDAPPDHLINPQVWDIRRR